MTVTASAAPRRVTFVKTLIKQYRRPFFEQLHQALLADNVEVEIVYGAPSTQERFKGDNIDLMPPLGRRIPSCYAWDDRLLVQWPGWRHVVASDLIIVVNANRNLLNIPLLALSRLGLKKVALWGHGQSHQSTKQSFRERFKERVTQWPDWWFAYTDQTAAYLASKGYDCNRITTINNAVDTAGFAAQVDAVARAELDAMRARLGLSTIDRVALYCGALYPEKRIPVLLETASKVADRNPHFRLLILGSGTQEQLVCEAASRYSFLRYAGPMFGRDKAICYRLAEFILNPGLVGLAILDAFAAGRPMLTLLDSLHSPEIAYLAHNQNGLLVDGDTNALADTTVHLLGDAVLYDRLCVGARKSSALYSTEEMVRRVRQGILQCLNASKIPH